MPKGATAGIESVENEYLTTYQVKDSWYSHDGIRLKGKPTKSGVYINGGRKVVVK